MELIWGNSGSDDDVKISRIGRKIYFTGPISSNSAHQLRVNLEEINQEYLDLLSKHNFGEIERPPIWLYICSGGGAAYSGISLIDAITSSYLPVYTVVNGYACSAATFLVIVGKKRYITRNSYMLIHQVSNTKKETQTYEECKDTQDNLKQMMDHIIKVYIENTFLKEEKKLREILTHNYDWNAEMCIKNGLVDQII